MKADNQGIKLDIELENIGSGNGLFSPIILHDENRIK